MTLYTKVYFNETEYEIKYNPLHGKQKVVSEQQDLYQNWLAEGGVPDVIPYVPPTPQPLEELRVRVMNLIQRKRTKTLNEGMMFEGMPLSTQSESREYILGGGRKAKKKPQFKSKVILLNGQVVEFSNQQLKDVEDAFDDFGDDVYNSALAEHEIALTANRTQLDYYVAHGEFN